MEVYRKIQERRLRWYGHVLRREEDHVTRRGLAMEVEGRRTRGRLRRRSMNCIQDDLAEKRLRERDKADLAR